MYILFYSRYCECSERFVRILQESGIANNVQSVLVDRDPITKRRHPSIANYNIKVVPTMVIDGRLFSGTKAFEWLSSVIQSMHGSPENGSVSSRDTRNPVNHKEYETVSEDVLTPINVGGDTLSSNNEYSNINADHLITNKVSEGYSKKFKVPIQNFTNSPLGSIMVIDPGTKEGEEPKELPKCLRSINVGRDKLKKKQMTNDYQKMLQERAMTVPGFPTGERKITSSELV